MGEQETRPVEFARHAVVLVAAGALYLVGARIATNGFGDGNSVEPLWIATAACAALALALRSRFDTAVILGAMAGEAVNSAVYFESGLGDTAAAMLANGVTLTVALILFRRIVGDGDGIIRVRQSVRWIGAAVAAGAAGALVNASWMIGTTHAIEDPLRWWLGDAVGLVVVAPIGLWSRHPWLRALHGKARAELCIVVALLVACTTLAFATRTPLMYLSLPLLGWLALRFGLRASSVMASVIAIWATIATGRGAGGFRVDGPDPRVQVQAYNVAVGLTAVIIGALATRVDREQRELQRAHADRLALEQRLSTVRGDERQRIARRLHDDAIQVLVAADLQLTAAKRRIGTDAAPQLDVVGDRIHLAIDELRGAIGSLVPPEMHGDRLRAGLEAVADQHRGPDGPRIEIDARLGNGDAGPTGGLDNTTGTALYQIAREAMANAVVHGRPQHVWVRVSADGRDATLTVDDDGVGVGDSDLLTSQDGHLGMRLMHERAMSVGGTVTIGAREGGGTSLIAVVPQVAAKETSE